VTYPDGRDQSNYIENEWRYVVTGEGIERMASKRHHWYDVVAGAEKWLMPKG